MKETKFEDLLGLTISKIVGMESESSEIVFICNDGRKFKMFHYQDCCEGVNVDEIIGNPKDLIGTPILLAEESSSGENPPNIDIKKYEYQDSFTWTFYRIGTILGEVTIRWYGESNGYYSEGVDFEEIIND